MSEKLQVTEIKGPTRQVSPGMYEPLHPSFAGTDPVKLESAGTHNEYRVVPTASLFTKELKKQIDHAKTKVDMQFYTLECDDQVFPIIEAAMAAAQRGVKVRIVTDHIVSDPRQLLATALVRRKANRLPNMSIQTASGLGRTKSLLSRDHKKIVTIDCDEAGGVAYIGGVNLARRSLRWNDFMIALGGPIAGLVQQDFDKTWEDKNSEAVLLPENSEPGTYLVTDSLVDQQIVPFALQMIGTASKRIWLETPYLDMSGLGAALIKAKWHTPSLDIKVIVPRYNNYPIHSLRRSNMLQPLAQAGIETYRYGVTYRRLNHAKLLLIDGTALFGSSNFNSSSMAGSNADIEVATENASLVSQLEKWYTEDIKESIRL